MDLALVEIALVRIRLGARLMRWRVCFLRTVHPPVHPVVT